MTPLLDVWNAAVPAVTWASLAALGIKLTTLALAGHLALALTRRASAARRHLVATTALAVLLLLPVADFIAPRWELPILPAGDSVPSAPASTAAEAENDPALTASTGELSDPLPPAIDREASSREIETAAPAAPSVPWRLLAWPAVLSVFVLAVTVTLWLVLLLAIAAAAFLAARSTEVRDSGLRAELDRARARVGVREPVRFKTRVGLRVPQVAGLFRPSLLIPAEAADWPRERLRAVLLHELAHVRRRDAWSLLLARAATAVWWFHPLVWLLAREAHRECERACDDLVLETGLRPSDYATHLLWVARHQRHGASALALAFARPSSLETRLCSILRADAPRGANSSRAMAIAFGVALLAMVPLASLRVVAAPSEQAIAVEEPSSPRIGGDDARESFPSHASFDPAGEIGVEAEPALVAVPASAGDPSSAPVLARFDGNTEPLFVPVQFDGKAEEPDPRAGARAFERGRNLYRSGDYGRAAESYLRAARAGHRRGTSLYNAACSFALDGRPEEALDALEASIEAGFEAKDYLASDDDLDALRGEPRFRRLAAEVRNTPEGEGDRRAALAEFEALRTSGSKNAEAWRDAGITLMRAGEYSKSARAFERQIAIEPEPNAHYNLACALGLGGDLERGLEELERAILAGYSDAGHMRRDADLAPLHGEDRFAVLVRLTEDLRLFKMGRDEDDRASWRRDLPHFERVTRRYPDAGRAWFNLGYARLRARDASGSYEAFERALELDHRVPTTTYNLACAAAQMGEIDEALRWLDRAEEKGMSMSVARGDRDLDPLRSDREFKARLQRWERDGGRNWKFGKR